MKYSIQIKHLTKRYKDFTALDNISLNIEKGIIFGLLGPNGAGKTTLIKILSTLIHFNSGEITINGIDLRKDPQQIREQIGLAGQYAGVDENLTAYENVYMIARLYHYSKQESRQKALHALEQVSLSEVSDKVSKTFSGGMRRRLDLAASFINEPKVLFLDEPTEGLDSNSRKELWKIIRNLASHGTTVILTTHFMEEADTLCDKIAIIGEGKILIEGENSQIKKQFGHDIIRIEMQSSLKQTEITLFEQMSKIKKVIKVKSNCLEIETNHPSNSLVEAVKIIDSNNLKILDVYQKTHT